MRPFPPRWLWADPRHLRILVFHRDRGKIWGKICQRTDKADPRSPRSALGAGIWGIWGILGTRSPRPRARCGSSGGHAGAAPARPFSSRDNRGAPRLLR